jgi:putative aldouronate transport system substrate-binding protein
MKKNKRIPALARAFVLALVFLAGTPVFAGARGQQQAGGSAATTGAKPSLMVGLVSDTFVTDYKNNYLTRYFEEMLGINLEFYLLPTGAETATKIALMVSSGDLPDVLLTTSLTDEQILDYGSKGALIAMDRYLDDPAKSPYFHAIPEPDRSQFRMYSTSADGHVYTLVHWQPESWNMTPHREYINKAWLDKLGLRIPATTDELRNVLIQFRDKDPNGNGRRDEIGLYGRYAGTYGENTIGAILNAFIFYNKDALALDSTGNKVIAPFTDPAFRKGLAYLNTLYKDGVLAAETFTNDTNQFRATLAANPPVVGFTSAGSVSNWPLADTNPNFLELNMIPPVKGPDGVNYTPYTGFVPSRVGSITSKARDPDLAWKLLDAHLEHTVSIISRFGQEDVDWTRKPELTAKETNAYVSLGLYPKISLIEMTGVWGEPSAQFWHNPGPRYASEEQGNTRGSYTRPFNPDSRVAILDAYNYQWYIDKHPPHILPLAKFSAEDALKIAEPKTNINTYIDQSVAEFVTGVRDINNDAHWNAYLRELSNLGLQTWIDAEQKTFDRQRR